MGAKIPPAELKIPIKTDCARWEEYIKVHWNAQYQPLDESRGTW